MPLYPAQIQRAVPDVAKQPQNRNNPPPCFFFYYYAKCLHLINIKLMWLNKKAPVLSLSFEVLWLVKMHFGKFHFFQCIVDFLSLTQSYSFVHVYKCSKSLKEQLCPQTFDCIALFPVKSILLMNWVPFQNALKCWHFASQMWEWVQLRCHIIAYVQPVILISFCCYYYY